MIIVYCIHSLYNPGGMERVLLNKVQWLAANTDWEIAIVTTDQHDRPAFYPIPDGVKMVDIGVNYSEDNGEPFWKKFFGYLRRRQLHKVRLSALLEEIRPDVVDCFYPGECSFVPGLRDGGKKVLELHQSKLFHHQYNRSGLMGLADKYRAWADERMVRRFDRFVVLTQEDADMWGNLPNMVVIPNAALSDGCGLVSDCSAKRVIAVGRMDYQKSYDRLIETWKIVHEAEPEWRLDIFGQGEWKEMLQGMIDAAGLNDCIALNAPVKNIAAEYATSSILVMSSHYEGFPMVMVEGMAHGLPAVSFDFKCGPRDIIEPGKSGLIVPDGDIVGLAEALVSLMRDQECRIAMGTAAREVVERYSEEKVMEKWLSCYR